MLDPCADHCITILVRRPRSGLPLGHVMAFAGLLCGAWTDALLLGDGLLDEPGVDRLLGRVRDIIEIGACDVPLGPRAVP